MRGTCKDKIPKKCVKKRFCNKQNDLQHNEIHILIANFAPVIKGEMSTKETEQQGNGRNPFLEPYNTPHNTIPFDRIRLEHYRPALEEGMRREDAEINAIVSNPEPPTFENTVAALDRSGQLLETVETVMGNLLSANTSDALEALMQQMVPALTEHSMRINYNQSLFERIKTVHDSHPDLTTEQQTLLDKIYEAFVRRGIGLPQEKKDELQQISIELSSATLQFSQNVLKDTNRFRLHITDKAEIKGLPPHQMEQAAQAARDKHLEGWLFTLEAPSFRPLLTYAANRRLRKKVYLAYNRLGIHRNAYNNLALVEKIVNLKQRYAQILGYACYADLALTQRMAGNVETVNRFINQLLEVYRPAARRDIKAISSYAKALEGDDFRLRPWDTAYYSHKLQIERYHVDAEMLRPYFELSQVIKGVFGLATRLYGITFKENRKIPVYHKDVKAYEVFDEDGTYLAVLYADFHPRSTKKSGAWMTSYAEQYVDAEGNDHRPHASITMNLSKPTDGKPALLTLGEVSTFLHEFGHALHQIFSRCRYKSLSGTNVYWDFVELPSQLMENFALEKDFLRTFAFHYQTGEPLPDELIKKVQQSRTFNAGLACVRQLSFCLLDMAYYTLREPFHDDVIRFEKHAWRKAMVQPQDLKVCMSTQFQHIMTGGYSAGYYCYKWAEVLDADAFSVFQQNGIFDRQTALRFRHEILEKGATENPQQLYRNFRQGEPSIDALVRRDGLCPKKHAEKEN